VKTAPLTTTECAMAERHTAKTRLLGTAIEMLAAMSALQLSQLSFTQTFAFYHIAGINACQVRSKYRPQGHRPDSSRRAHSQLKGR
jgi:hypothetical protein